LKGGLIQVFLTLTDKKGEGNVKIARSVPETVEREGNSGRVFFESKCFTEN
jgi:hypothetical protein